MIGGRTFTERYTYSDGKNGNGTLAQMTAANGAKIDFDYDDLKRLDYKTVTHGSTELLCYDYNYKSITLDEKSYTTPLVEQHTVSKLGVTLTDVTYSYDNLGNITQITQATGSKYPLAVYLYDAQGQMTAELLYDGLGNSINNVVHSYVYAYDTAGNLLTEYYNGTLTKTYSYTDTYWGDKLTALGSMPIYYDEVGNPVGYASNGNLYDLTWEHGRQLAAAFVDNAEYRYNLTFDYDADGIRTMKDVDGTTHYYLTQNGKVVRETIGTGSTAKILDFIYDESGKPFALNYSVNGGTSFITYYYVLNLQGDVESLISSSGYVTASYTYNAWGEILSVTDQNGNEPAYDHIANLNPLRYRGYYYDTETGWYYLQSRYYDPAMHRFINADSFASTGQGLLGANMFVYCGNNPVFRIDDEGQFWNFIVGAVVGAVVNAVTTAVEAVQEGGWDALTEGETWAKIGVSAVTGAVGGVVAASGVGLGAAVAWGAGTAAVESVGHQVIDTGTVNAGQLLADTAGGAIGGLIGGKGAINGNKYMNRQVSRVLTHRKTDGLKKALNFGWKMTKNYSKQFVLPTVWGIGKSVAGGKIANAIMEMDI